VQAGCFIVALPEARQGSGYVFNLGHGVLPETPVENAKAMIEAVKRLSVAFHKMEVVV